MANVEDLQSKLQILLCQADMEVVNALAERLGIEQEKWKKKKSQMISIICDVVDNELEKKESGEQQELMLQELIGRCNDMTQQDPGDGQAEKDVEIVKITTQESEEEKRKSKKDQQLPKKKTTTENQSYYGLTSVLRRQFKIIGQIGEPNQKDKLSYTSLVRQIEAGVNHGFTEKEVREGVIRAISLGLVLRSYLEMYSDLTLDR